MKKLLTAFVLLGSLLLAPLSQAGEMRKFTSADGEKTLFASISKVDAKNGIVQLALKNGKVIKAPIKSFSKEDQDHIRKVHAIQFVHVRFVDKEQQVSEKKNPTNGFQTLKLKSGYGLEIRNMNKTDVGEMKANYQIFYKAYSDPFQSKESKDKIKEGSLDLPAVAARKDATASTEQVDLTRIKQLPKSECVGGT